MSPTQTPRSGALRDTWLQITTNSLYKWELIYPRGPWSGLTDVEFATLTYVHWFNTRRLHGEINDGPGYTTTAALEAEYRQFVSTTHVETQTPECP